MPVTNLRKFKHKARHNRRRFRLFLTRMEKFPVPDLTQIARHANEETWKEIDCLTCANCCKTMTPTFTPADIQRISAHLNMTPKAFREKWLYKDNVGDWLNKKQPCQFLNLEDNKCSIYEVRPADCAGFPHHHKKKFDDYAHVFKQNVELCPATYTWVEKMIQLAYAK